MRLIPTCALLAGVVCCSSAASAQSSEVQLDVLPAQSQFHCGGASLLGELLGPVGELLQVDGVVDVQFAPLSNGELYARIANLDVIALEDIVLKVQAAPLPPTLVVAVRDLRIQLDVNSFIRVPEGQYDLQGFCDIQGGEIEIAALGATSIALPLAGTSAGYTLRTGGWVNGGLGTALMLDLPLELDIDLGHLSQTLGLSLELEGRVLARRITPPTQSYCTGSANSLGCTASIGSSGVASATAGSGFEVHADHVRAHSAGLLFYGTNGRNQHPFAGGTLCVALPLTRTPLQFAGGDGAQGQSCTGRFEFDFNAWIAGQPVESAVRIPGSQVNCQWWSRDLGVASTTVTSNALEFTVGL